MTQYKSGNKNFENSISTTFKIQNNLFHCKQLLEKVEVTDRLQKLWTELVQMLHDDWHGAYLDNCLLCKYATDQIVHSSEKFGIYLTKTIWEWYIEEKTHILNRENELLVEFIYWKKK